MLCMCGVHRCPDRGERPHAGRLPGRGDHCGTPERMSDEDVGDCVLFGHELACPDDVIDLDGERTIAPVALRVTQSERIEAQHADAVQGELLADASGGRRVLAKRESVREDAPAAWLPGRPV